MSSELAHPFGKNRKHFQVQSLALALRPGSAVCFPSDKHRVGHIEPTPDASLPSYVSSTEALEGLISLKKYLQLVAGRPQGQNVLQQGFK